MKLKGTVKKGKVSKKSIREYAPVVESSRKDFKVKTIRNVGATHIPSKNEWSKEQRILSKDTPYSRFLRKYLDLDNQIDNFNTQDLLFYFREVANENGFKYMINFSKEGSQMKRLLQTFDRREICGMIEFLYTSNQNYLPKDRLSIGLLCSSWVNTIYADFQLWLDDEYYPYGKKDKNDSNKHEWKEKKNSSVGEWEV